MEFGLTKRGHGSSSFLSITEEEFKALAEAKGGHLSTLFFEEKFDLLLENFLELEDAMLQSTGRQMVHRGQDYEWLKVEMNFFNRRLVNLLSACRSYVDYAPHYVRTVLPEDQEALGQSKAAFSRHYDSRLGYRVMEALRNFVQHKGFPIHVVTYSAKKPGHNDAAKSGHGVSIFTKTIYLRDDQFKKSVFDELEALGGRVDLKPFIREYIGALGDVHEQLRALTKPGVAKWETAFEQAVQRFNGAFPAEESLPGLCAFEQDARDGEVVEIFSDPIEYRKALEEKNRDLKALESRYVTGEVL